MGVIRRHCEEVGIEEHLPQTLPGAKRAGRSPWIVGLLVANGVLSLGTLLVFGGGFDFEVLQRAAEEAGTTALYSRRGSHTFVWSPVAAYPLQLIAPLGLHLWRLVLVAAALAMPTWTLRVMVLVSWPFWTDVASGNIVTLIFLSAVWAWRGSRAGTATFFVLAVLVPRPLLAPMALWILWKRPEWRVPFTVLFLVHAALVAWTGLGPTWISTLLAVGPELQSAALNLSPTRFVGYWWMLLGVPLGGWLLYRGRVGWAGLAISPYVWFYYLYWALPEVNRSHSREFSADSRTRIEHVGSDGAVRA